MMGNLIGEKFGKIRKTSHYKNGTVNISGLSEGRTAPLLSLTVKERKSPFLVVTSAKKRAEDLAEDMSFFLDILREDGEEGVPVFLIPEDEKIFLNYDARSRSLSEERMKGVLALTSGRPCVVIATVKTALRKTMPKTLFEENAFTLKTDLDFDRDDLNRRLTLLGYERTSAIEAKGQYSIRGDIADVFPLDRDNPVRVEFFGDTIDSIREFNPETQRSVNRLTEVRLSAARDLLFDEERRAGAAAFLEKAVKARAKKLKGEEHDRLVERKGKLLENISTGSNPQSLTRFVTYFYENPECLIDYLSDDGCLVIEDYDRCRERTVSYEKEVKEEFASLLERGEVIPEDFGYFPGIHDFERAINEKKGLVYLINPFTGGLKGVEGLKEIISVRNRSIPDYNNRMEMFLEDLREYRRKGFATVLVCESEERKKSLSEFLNRNSFSADLILTGRLSAGSEYTDEKLAIISDRNIFAGTRAKKPGKKKTKPIKAFIDIKRGDYVVHENHGIGRFEEITQLEIEGIKRDYLKIQYAGEDVLYVPVDQMDCVQKYIGAEAQSVKVNRLSNGEWNRVKQKARESIRKMAMEIMQLTAERRSLPGYAFSPDSDWQREFEDSFPYAETQDQLTCAEEIKKDMQKPVPMERLLCGDVGYGKTEVAARAVFKCLADGKQAAVLVPTTILAGQHYNTFRERLESFPFNVEVMSRFKSEEQQKKIVQGLKTGSVDLVIGTHRLLSKDVAFKDLGLLIIDEEQRFGVQHKEALKLLRKNVDVLTLSATPIPRTLHMSLIGARDMSIIEEPPEERYPVQTYVMEEDGSVIREAIQSELDRGGQCFVVYNRVRDIRQVADRIQALVPEADVAVGHGRMGEEALENVIIDFIEQKTNVLVCTTIIETGIDMPNANTMIILDADRFGLSQLYQLRGRVGRSTRIAYAFLMYKGSKTLSEVAEKRLTAIKQFTELGSGFKIAMRDLELRGAGNILGVEQSGHMVAVGYELYCKMLDETLGVLKGERQEEEEPEVSIELDVNAYIPQEYINEETQRVEIYQKIAGITSEEEREDIIDEIIDRFGDPPREVINLSMVALIKENAKAAGVERISEDKAFVRLTYIGQSSMKVENIPKAAGIYGKNIEFNAGRKPYVRFKPVKMKTKLKETMDLLMILRA